MSIEAGSIEHLSQIISHVATPAFLLAAVGSFTSLVSNRLMGVVGRIRDLTKAGRSEDTADQWDEALNLLRRRAKLLNRAILFSIASAIVTVVLIIGAFAAALTEVHHVWIAAILFMMSGVFLLSALITLGVDVKMGITGDDLH